MMSKDSAVTFLPSSLRFSRSNFHRWKSQEFRIIFSVDFRLYLFSQKSQHHKQNRQRKPLDSAFQWNCDHYHAIIIGEMTYGSHLGMGILMGYLGSEVGLGSVLSQCLGTQWSDCFNNKPDRYHMISVPQILGSLGSDDFSQRCVTSVWNKPMVSWKTRKRVADVFGIFTQELQWPKQHEVFIFQSSRDFSLIFRGSLRLGLGKIPFLVKSQLWLLLSWRWPIHFWD